MVKINNNIFSNLFFMQMTENHAVVVQSAVVTATSRWGRGSAIAYRRLFRRVFRPAAAIQCGRSFTLNPDDSRAFVLSHQQV